jgi:ABC-type branched-subunit amino acid transport system ATPase component
MTDVLKIKNPYAWYCESRVLHGVDVRAHDEEVVTPLRRNGAGLTTVLRGAIGATGANTGSIGALRMETIGLTGLVVEADGASRLPDSRLA